MQIDHLREFLTLVQTENFGDAAAKLFINQSTLSKHIQRLEDEFGVPLFTRTSRKVDLTEYGRTLIPYARTIVDTEYSCKDHIQTLKDELSGKLFLGVIPSMIPYKLTNIITSFFAQYPNDQIKILEEDSLNLIEALRQRKCSLAFLRESDEFLIDEAEFCKIPYTTDQLVALLSNEHPLSGQASIQLTQLKEDSFILLNQGTLLNKIFLDCFQHAGFIPNVLMECQRMDSIFNFIALNMGISLTTNRHVQYVTDRYDRFAVIPIDPPVYTRTYLCYLKNAKLNTAARHFISHTKKMIPDLF